jgi:hypothetical protein
MRELLRGGESITARIRHRGDGIFTRQAEGARDGRAPVRGSATIENPMLTTALRSLISLAILLPCTRAGELELAAQGKPLCTIVIAGAADEAERHAADELARFLGEISGAHFEVKALTQAGSGPRILVGREAVGVLIRADEYAALGDEGYLVRTQGSTIAISGAKPRGTLYGVYALLEEHLHCRWFTPEVARIPKNASPTVPGGDLRFVPPLEYRATDYPNSRDGDWAVRNHLNGTQTRIDKARGGKIDYSHFVHTFNSIVNPTELAAHPDWFSEVGGKRTADNAQLCVTNPAVLARAIETVRAWMKEAPDATIFSVSQNDCFNPCECASCKKLFSEEGEAWSGPYLRFVNAIAAALAKEFPGKALDTLAYQFTRKPPAHAKPLGNVIVRLCSIECCFAHPLDSPAELDAANAAFAFDLGEWSARSKRLYIWDYVIDYAHTIMPFPNLTSIAPNIRFFVKNGVKGVYEEADYFTPGGEFAELRTWILAKTLWNPEYDTERAIAEFLDGFYEDAQKPLAQYIRLMHDRAAQQKIHFTIGAGPDSLLFDEPTLKRADELFDEAEKAVAGKPAVLERVKTARLPLLYVEFSRAPSAVLLERFDAIAKKSSVTMINEWQPYDAWLVGARAIAGAAK